MRNIIIDEKEIDEILTRMGKELTLKFKDDKEPPVFIVILKGATPFAMELIKHIDCFLELEFVQYSSYNGGTVSTKNLVMKKDVTANIKKRNVIVLDDVLDSGYTLQIVKEHLKSFKPKNVYTCVFLDKKDCRPEGFFEADFVGKKIDNLFICGFGLDYNELYRNVPYIFVPTKEELALADSKESI